MSSSLPVLVAYDLEVVQLYDVQWRVLCVVRCA